MRALQVQFFLTYAILGSYSTLLAVYLEYGRGLSPGQVGLAMSMVGLANLVSPWLMTFLADTHLQARHILAGSCGMLALILALLCIPGGYAVTIGLMAVLGLAVVATLPLQDGYFFSWAAREAAEGRTPPTYASVRLWGTIGFIVPSVFVYLALHYWRAVQGDVRFALLTGVVFALASVWSSLYRLPSVPPAAKRSGPMPTLEAMSVFARPPALIYVACMALAAGAVVSYHYFFPRFLKSELHLASEWIPIIINIGVVGEVFYTLWTPHLERRFGTKKVIVFGLAALVLRLILLALFPSVLTAVAVQALHGMEICAFFIVGPVLLNKLASDRFRNSIQGAFSMILGLSRFIGSNITGRALEHVGFTQVFLVSAGIASMGLIVIALFFKPWETDHSLPTRPTTE